MQPIFPESHTSPTQGGDMDPWRRPIWAIWFAEVSKFHHSHGIMIKWLSVTIINCCMKLLIRPQTSTMQLFKIVNWSIIPSHLLRASN